MVILHGDFPIQNILVVPVFIARGHRHPHTFELIFRTLAKRIRIGTMIDVDNFCSKQVEHVLHFTCTNCGVEA